MPTYYEPEAGTTPDPHALFTACVENGAGALLLDTESVPDAFFDLATGFAGELLHQLSKYRLRLACVVPDLDAQPERFREFAREANRGQQYRFLPTRAEAIAWLEAD